MKEIWKDVPNYENLYQVSNLGRVKSLERFRKNNKKEYGYTQKEKIIKTPIGGHGYPRFNVRKNNKTIQLRLHRVVAKKFIPNPENKPCINHKDGNKLNNNVNNLEWVTYSENHYHAYKKGLKKVNDKFKKKVLQYDKNMNFIKEYSSIYQASKENNLNATNISKCCKGIRYYKSIGGFIWKFKK